MGEENQVIICLGEDLVVEDDRWFVCVGCHYRCGVDRRRYPFTAILIGGDTDVG